MQDDNRTRHNLITRERLLKGDLEIGRDGAGYINEAHIQDHSIFNMLCVMNCADDGHVATIMTYQDWKGTYDAKIGYKIGKMFERQSSALAEDKSTNYLDLIRAMTTAHQRLIEESLHRHSIPLAKAAVYNIRNRYLGAIEKMAVIISDVRKENACGEK